jgi:hypothetical protein
MNRCNDQRKENPLRNGNRDWYVYQPVARHAFLPPNGLNSRLDFRGNVAHQKKDVPIKHSMIHVSSPRRCIVEIFDEWRHIFHLPCRMTLRSKFS